jgi:hypothetical protein
MITETERKLKKMNRISMASGKTPSYYTNNRVPKVREKK